MQKSWQMSKCRPELQNSISVLGNLLTGNHLRGIFDALFWPERCFTCLIMLALFANWFQSFCCLCQVRSSFETQLRMIQALFNSFTSGVHCNFGHLSAWRVGCASWACNSSEFLRIDFSCILVLDILPAYPVQFDLSISWAATTNQHQADKPRTPRLGTESSYLLVACFWPKLPNRLPKSHVSPNKRQGSWAKAHLQCILTNPRGISGSGRIQFLWCLRNTCQVSWPLAPKASRELL